MQAVITRARVRRTGRSNRLKRAVDQALLLRGSRGFVDLSAYEQFIAETARRLNARCARAWDVERMSLRALAVRRTVDFEEIDNGGDRLPFGANSLTAPGVEPAIVSASIESSIRTAA